MKIKQVCIVVLLCLVGIPDMQAQTFDKLWQQVEEAEKQSLPETVIKLTNEIYWKGEKEKNSPQMLKAYMWRMNSRDAITPDSFYISLDGLEKWAQQVEKPMDRAILHSLMAEIYADYAGRNQWTLRQQTEIVGETPSDIREWTINMFIDKVQTHTQKSLTDSVLLLKTSSRTYIPFVELGEASEYYHHDMYHLLASRGIAALSRIERLDNKKDIKQSIEKLFKNMLSAYHNDKDKEGYVLTSLNYLKWKERNDSAFRPFRTNEGEVNLTQSLYMAGLDKLQADYKSFDICAEVYRAKVDYMIMQRQLVAALQLCDEAIRDYPSYRRINALKNIREDIVAPSLFVNTPNEAFPGEEVKVRATHKNLDGLTLRIYQADKLISEQHYSFLRPRDYHPKDTIFTFKASEIGKYIMRIVPDIRAKENREYEFGVTRMKVLTCRLPQDEYATVVLDAQTGHPISGANVTLYDEEQKALQEFTTGKDGKIVFPWKSQYRFLTATKGKDNNMPKQNIFSGSFGRFNVNEAADNEATGKVILLTDRSIYRPGQTVYLKGIAYKQGVDSAHVIPNKEYTVTLIDANRQSLEKKTLRTNEFGSFTTEFTLPSSCLNGTFWLDTPNGGKEIRVENYKRPTFDITFEKQQGSYQLGDEVQVKGKAQSYNGVMLQNLPVKYTVICSANTLWGFRGGEQIASGEVMVGNEGEFTIPVRLEENSQFKNDEKVYYRYKITATVTNLAGETQTFSDVLFAGNRSLNMQVSMKEKNCKDDSVTVMFKVQNLSSQPVKKEGTYRLFRAKDKLMKDLDREPVITGTFISNKEMAFDWENLPSGAYVLKASVKDDQENEIVVEANTILFSAGDKRPPVETPKWFYESNTLFDATHPAVFYFGTSEKDTYVMVNVFSNSKLLESKTLNLSDSVVRFEYPYEESYGEGIVVNICMVKDGKIYQQQVQLQKRLPDNTLNMKWDVFRDKLRPGQKEEWKLTIKNPQGKPANAEMLATMYDASLDKIWNQPQPFSLFYSSNLPYINWMDKAVQSNSFDFLWDKKLLKVSPMEYDHFVTQASWSIEDKKLTGGLQGIVPGILARQSGKSETGEFWIRGVGSDNKKTMTGAVTNVTVSELESAVVGNVLAGSVAFREELSIAPAGLRTNLEETAFFYPLLRTNERGEVSFSFTAPESLTRWNFRGYSHTQNMMLGTLDGEATTSKEFMLIPNLPRFVRMGDHTSIATSISNMTGKSQTGTVSMVLFDPMTDQVISTQKQKFTVEAGETIGVNFLFTVSDKYEVLGCRLIADSGTFSDGEQQLLPVVSNKEHLVESLPMPVRGEETRTFSLDSLFNRHSKTATDRKLTIEFTGNPAWYAIQALPSLNNPLNDNAISWATAYYANTLAAYIMNSQPRIKAMFDTWRLQGGTKETFLSNLQKNQEVKNIILSESPWVLEAQTEEQQKERIATLFDLNNTRNNNEVALMRLKDLQNSTGGWSWFEGMNSSLYVTNYITTLNACLATLTGEKPTGVALNIQQKAFEYLHQQALKEYKDILKSQKEGVKVTGISGSILNYLYLIAISGEQVPAANQEAYAYYLSKVGEMLSSQSMSTKAISAIVLMKAGRDKEAQAFIASLKEHLTKTSEQGMFFAFNENPFNWGSTRIQTQVYAMEALSLAGGNGEIIEEMKLWLLKQKQTQQWNSPVATADAVYALLMQGINLLDNQGDVRIKIANQVLETTSSGKGAIPGLGYVKRSFTEKNVVDARTIKVEKKSPGIAWGAVYAEYESPVRDVKQQGGELNVEKQLYLERMVNNAPQLLPITEKTTLQIGDKVVSRLTVRVDRQMDFVQLKDQRAACFEPIGSISGYRWNNGLGYYIDIKDASTNFFFDRLGKGVYVLEHSYWVSREGTYETGLATIQCAYAPEYVSHTGSVTVVVSSDK